MVTNQSPPCQLGHHSIPMLSPACLRFVACLIGTLTYTFTFTLSLSPRSSDEFPSASNQYRPPRSSITLPLPSRTPQQFRGTRVRRPRSKEPRHEAKVGAQSDWLMHRCLLGTVERNIQRDIREPVDPVPNPQHHASTMQLIECLLIPYYFRNAPPGDFRSPQREMTRRCAVG